MLFFLLKSVLLQTRVCPRRYTHERSMVVISTLSPLFFGKKPFKSLIVHVLYDVLGAQTHSSHFDGKSLEKKYQLPAYFLILIL